MRQFFFIVRTIFFCTSLLSLIIFAGCSNDNNDGAVSNTDSVQIVMPDTMAPILVDTTLVDSLRSKQAMKNRADTGHKASKVAAVKKH